VFYIKSSLIAAFLLFGCKVIPQKKDRIVQIENIKLFKDFPTRGFTTVGAYTHFDDMKELGIEQLHLSADDKEILQQIMNRAKKMKHFQHKLAGGLMFCEIQFADQSPQSRVVIGIDPEVAGIMDLTNRIDFVVTNPADLKWLSDFSERIKNKQ
jgi:hypothetical protein